jgi:hypothetical protein
VRVPPYYPVSACLQNCAFTLGFDPDATRQ